MKWASALSHSKSSRATLKSTLDAACKDVLDQLDGKKPDLLIAFVSPHFIDNFTQVPALIKKLIDPKTFIGCSAGGLIGGGVEIEHKPAVAISAAVLPDVEIVPFHIEDPDLPDLDDGPHKWEALVGIQPDKNPSFILLPDPFSFRIEPLVQGLDFAFQNANKIGGLASGANQPGFNALFMNDKVYRSGCVGIGMHGNLVVETIVAQGCRPIGKPMTVTKCRRNILFELNGKPAVNALHDILEDLPEHDQQLARNSLFLGVVMDEFKSNFKPGDFLIRNIFGVEPQTGALVVGEVLRDERTVQFHLRDAATSADDLRFLLKEYRDSHENGAVGALLFSCLGRGEHLYGIPNHDSECFRQYMGSIPLGGFFCNGEIGPVGGTTFLHGYTSSFGIFRPLVH